MIGKIPKESSEHTSSTMSTVDEKISNLQSAVASLTASVATLTAEVAHLSGKSFPPQTMKTSIPLTPMQQSTSRTYNRPETGRRPYREMQNRPSQPQAAHSRASYQAAQSSDAPRMIALSDILVTDEDVTFYVNTGNDSNGNMTQTTAVASFDGTDLVVSTCDLIPSLVGLQTQKPGEILYKFIEELKNANHIKRTFSVAPWKLCYVVRNGQQQTLDELRKVFTSQ